MKKKRRERKPAEGSTAPRTERPFLPGPWYTHVLAFAAVMVATWVLYRGDLNLGFLNLDDPTYVVNNPWIDRLSGTNLWRIWSQPYFANYSPMHIVSYLLDVVLAGKNPHTFHASSNLWAGLAAGFVYLLGVALFESRLPALAAAVLFAVHPAHVEAVAWISSRKDLVAAAFALPSILAYLCYRRGGRGSRWWYLASLLLFALAVAGKLSAVVVPVLLFAFDLARERRWSWAALVDKLPYVALTGFVALRTMGSQPETGGRPGLANLGHTLLADLWLLIGFGRYTMLRGVPDLSAAPATALTCIVAPLLLVGLPLIFWRRLPPLALALCAWVLVSLGPSQVLSFVHPVTDRYLYFPSVGVALLAAAGMAAAARRWGRTGSVVATVLAAALALAWGRNAIAYLAEWQDPRSLWYAAAKRSADIDLPIYLGGHYQDASETLEAPPQGAWKLPDGATALAAKIWQTDPRLGRLLEEWKSSPTPGALTAEFRDELRDLAWVQFEVAAGIKSSRVVPVLFFRRGRLQFSRGRYAQARDEFLRTLDEAGRHTYLPTRQEYTVQCHYSLGVVAWHDGKLEEALRWMRLADDEQTRFGGHWVGGLGEWRRKLEARVAPH